MERNPNDVFEELDEIGMPAWFYWLSIAIAVGCWGLIAWWVTGYLSGGATS